MMKTMTKNRMLYSLMCLQFVSFASSSKRVAFAVSRLLGYRSKKNKEKEVPSLPFLLFVPLPCLAFVFYACKSVLNNLFEQSHVEVQPEKAPENAETEGFAYTYFRYTNLSVKESVISQ